MTTRPAIPRLHYLARPGTFDSIEQPYVDVRRSEGRLFDDSLVRQLPKLPRALPLAAEWTIRDASSKRLIAALAAFARNLPGTVTTGVSILDLGCGNGWLSARLARLPGSRVLGLDINSVELEQANRVFGHVPNLRFAYGDIFSLSGPLNNTDDHRADIDTSFDIIVCASALQYFDNLSELVIKLRSSLNPSGQIHFLDSPVYNSDAEVAAAQARTKAYFEHLKVDPHPAYHSHRLSTLLALGAVIHYNPHGLFVRALRIAGLHNPNPFYWLMLHA